MPRRGNPSGHRERPREVAGAELELLIRMAEHHTQEGQPRGRRRAQGGRGTGRQIFQSGCRRGGLTSPGRFVERTFPRTSAVVAPFKKLGTAYAPAVRDRVRFLLPCISG